MQATEKKSQVTLVKRDSGVVLFIFDANGKFNYLGTDTINELEAALYAVADDDSVRGLVIISGKPDSFIIGADVFEIRRLKDVNDLERLSRRGQHVVDALSNLNKPAVAAINGACLGGGLELVMGCDYRIATDSPGTRFGLPETRLGIVPGIGGTQRLPRLVGLKTALSMMLQSEIIDGAKALESGLIDEITGADQLIERAEQAVLRLCESFFSEKTDPGVKATRHCRVDLDLPRALKLIAVSERAVKLTTRGHYPAQTRLLEVVKAGIEHGHEHGQKVEARAFAELASSKTSNNLMNLYLATELSEQYGRLLVRKAGGHGVKSVAVLGGGNMGTSLAAISAGRGLDTTLCTRPGRKDEVESVIAGLTARAGTRGSSDESAPVRVSDTGYGAIAGAELVLECVLEDVDVKSKVISECARSVSADCVLASNTSCLPIASIAADVPGPERCVGLHFFHPVDKMPLVEVIAHKGTSQRALAKAMSYVLSLGKTPCVVADSPGFLINRLLTTYIFQAARLAERTPVNWVEQVAFEYGMPMGPYQLIDEVGADVCLTVADYVSRNIKSVIAPRSLALAIALQLKGRKGGGGFYEWDGDRRTGFSPFVAKDLGYLLNDEKCPEDKKQQIWNSLVLPMVGEAARCLEEKIVGKPREIDVAVVLGFGFPAFHGGLLRYADNVGLPEVVRLLAEIYEADGAGAEICELLKRYAGERRGFYSLAGKDEE